MSSAVKNKRVPELRFKEFEGEWVYRKMLNFAPLQRGFDLPVAKIKHGKYPVVFSNGIMKTHNEFKVRAPGVVTGRSGTIGKVTFVEKDFWPHNTALWVTSFLDNVPKFVFYFYSNFKLERLSTGSGVPTLNRNNVHATKRYVPKIISEQQKIASFLSAVDQKIQLLTQKKEALEQYKKGLMQKLFSGELRFKPDPNELEGSNGKDYPEWEEKRMKEFLKIGSGKDHKALESGNIPVFGTGGLMRYVNEKLHSGETVFIGRKGTIDKPFFFNGAFWTVDTLFYTYDFQEVSPFFVFILFQRVNWKLYNEASGVPSLSKSTLEKIKFQIPSLNEQKKIANALMQLDNKIEAIASQITQTQAFKKGLLQKMFV